jgi:pimeloyl-ACP methyl ester carboxylesterase
VTPTETYAELSQGPVRYRDAGSGDPIVFVHGYLVDGRLWEGTAAALEGEFRCVAPDWPLGAHTKAMKPDADLTPPGLARIIADFLAELDLDRVTIVGNDSGGAISQVLATRHPERIARLVLTNCDTYEHFPPFPFNLMVPVARIPGGMSALALPFRIGAIRRAAFAPFAKRKIPDALSASWMSPSATDAGVKRDLRKVTAGFDKRYTLEAAEHLSRSELDVLFAWAPEDHLFKLADAERLAAAIPNARLETIPDAGTFVPFDQPQRVADAISGFAR